MPTWDVEGFPGQRVASSSTSSLAGAHFPTTSPHQSLPFRGGVRLRGNAATKGQLPVLVAPPSRYSALRYPVIGKGVDLSA